MHHTKQRIEARAQRPGDALLSVEGVTKEFELQSQVFKALQGVDLEVDAGEFLAIVGRSGSGKSTLLNMIAGIDRPTSGGIVVDGARIHEMSQDELAIWRGLNVGVVFQFFQLLPTLTVLENVMLPMDFRGTFPSRERAARAQELLARVGVEEQATKLPYELSGGQQQRAAIARALANAPSVLVADEPTGNLDTTTAEEILDLFAELRREGTTIIVVTHEREIGRWATRTVEISDGLLVTGSPRTGAEPTSDAVKACVPAMVGAGVAL